MPINRKAVAILTNIRDQISASADAQQPVQGWVVNEVAGRVRVRFLGETDETASEQRFNRLAGPPFAPGAEVFCTVVGGRPFVLDAIQRGEGSPSPYVEGTGANPSAPVFDVLCVVPKKIRWQGAVRSMTIKEQALALRMVNQFPGMMQVASGGRVGVRVRLVVQEGIWDLDTEIATNNALITPFESGVFITEDGAHSLWDTYKGMTYDCRFLFLGTSQMNSSVNQVTRRGNNYSFINPEDSWFDADRDAQRVTDVMVAAFSEQINNMLIRQGNDSVDLTDPATAGYTASTTTGLMDFYQFFWQTSDLSVVVDDHKTPSIDQRAVAIPFSHVDLVDPWGVVAAPFVPQTATWPFTTPVKTYEVFAVIVTKIKYNNVVTTMTSKELAYCHRVIDQMPGLVNDASAGKMKLNIHVVFRDLLLDLDAKAAAGIALQSVGGGSGKWFGGNPNGLILGEYGATDPPYDSRMVMTSVRAFDLGAYAWTGGDFSHLGCADQWYDDSSVAKRTMDVWVHEFGHFLESEMSAAGVNLGSTGSGLHDNNNFGFPSDQPLVDWMLWYRYFYQKNVDITKLTPRGVAFTPDSRTALVPLTYVDIYKSWDAVQTPPSGGAADAPSSYQQSMDINYLGTLVKDNPDSIDFRDGLLAVISGNGVRLFADFGSGANQVARGNHTQAATTISDFAEAVQDVVGAMVQGAGGATVAYDDTLNRLTITASGSGGGSYPGGFNDGTQVVASVTQINAHQGLEATVSGVSGRLDLHPIFAGSGFANSVARSDHTHTDTGERTVATHYRNVATSLHDGADVIRSQITPANGTISTFDSTGALRTQLASGSSGYGSLALLDNTGAITVILNANTASPSRFSAAPTVGPTTGSAVPVSVQGHTHTAASVTDFTEAVQDAVAAFLQASTGVTLTYDDPNNTLTITGTTGGGGSGTTDLEAVRDAIGVALLGVGNITVTPNDAADTITISTTATANSTDAQLRDRATHTGSQAISTVSGLQALLDAKNPTLAIQSLGATFSTNPTAIDYREGLIANLRNGQPEVLADFGGGFNQIPRGDHTHPGIGGNPVIGSGEYIGPIHFVGGTVGSAGGFGGGNLYLFPISIDTTTTFTSIAIRRSDAASANAHLGVYASGSDGLATGAPLRDVTLSLGSSAGVKIASLGTNLTLTPGRYWLAWISDVSITLVGIPAANATTSLFSSVSGDISGTFVRNSGYGRGQAYGAMPSNPAKSYGLANVPYIFLIAA